MAAAKKAATKKVATKRAPKDNGIYWVVSQRDFVTWVPKYVYKTEAAARAAERQFENYNPSVIQKYKVSRVELVL